MFTQPCAPKIWRTHGLTRGRILLRLTKTSGKTNQLTMGPVMARFYSNENFLLPVVEALRGHGHDVLTVQDAGKANQEIPDDEVLAYASAENRAVLTLNRRDFIRLHRQQPAHGGIIVCTADLNFTRQAQSIHEDIAALPSLSSQLFRINRPATVN